MTKRELIYADAAPFAAAIKEWVAVYRKRHRNQIGFRDVRDLKRRKPGDEGSGLEDLARRTGIPARSLRSYASGERQYISIDNADRLAMGLNTPLWMLADEFIPMREVRRRQNEVVA